MTLALGTDHTYDQDDHHDPPIAGPSGTSSSYDPTALQLAPHHLLDAFSGLNVCAPMVRYSKLPFRALVSRYDTHVNFTPMMLAKEFSRSQGARDAEMTTNQWERGTFHLSPGVKEATESAQRFLHSKSNARQEGQDASGLTAAECERETRAQDQRSRRKRICIRGGLVAQFASSTPQPLADACELVAKTVDGVDLNCGCPQQWAYDEELGCFLLRKPEMVRDMVRAVKARLGEDYCVSVKIRVDDDLQLTDRLVRTALHAGASILTIHGRTRHQASTQPVDLDAIRFAVDAANACGFRTAWGSRGGAAAQFADGGSGGLVPCVANGDVWSLEEAVQSRRHTGARGAMSARGLLANPALFAGYDQTPAEAVSLFTTLATHWSLHTALTHRHLAYMLESSFPNRSEAIHFNSLNSLPAITDWLGETGYLAPVVDGPGSGHGDRGGCFDPMSEFFGYRSACRLDFGARARVEEMLDGFGIRRGCGAR